MPHTLHNTTEKGFILPSIVVLITFLIVVAASFLQLASSSYSTAIADKTIVLAQLAADGGIDYSMNKISQDPTWLGTDGLDADTDPDEIELHNDGTFRTTFTSQVYNPAVDEKYFEITGRSYRLSDNSLQATRSFRVDLSPVVFGDASIITGNGGLVMDNSSKVVAGSVFINGTLTMNNSSQIGLSVNPVSVEVAHFSCPNPPDATYPQQCADGENGEPITMNNSAHIYGDVRATNQTDGSGMSDGGLVPNQTVADRELPPHERDTQIAAITTERSGNDASCTSNNGVEIWEANTKINGNVTVSKKCTVIIEGDIWITGDFTMRNQGKIIVDDLVSTTPYIMIDGDDIDFMNSTEIIANNFDVGANIIGYYSTAPCSPDCSNVTGPDFESSKDLETITINNSLSAPNTLFYARWTKLTVFNSGSIGALVGQTIHLRNSAAVTFGTDISGTGTQIWVIRTYKRI
ncbi:TPA: hypothetical protein EYO12_03130 [Candidatus Saccharibacteria bacterium]|nr:hypothetical protein [Candidatus Saccharibacteria bacterium]HIO87973.1 hypothetical protein [Candidatus Saccharibacteria bacterium]